jgi:Fur family ferric uptake transcriptional regulator
MQQQTALSCRKNCGKSGYCREILGNYLEQSGGRWTHERALLLQISCELKTHFTTEHIQHKLARRGFRMAMTTIYRNLPALEKAGIIRRTTFSEEEANGAATYEHIWGRPHHDHLLCQRCGKKTEFTYDAIEVLQDEVARKHGYKLLHHHLELIGICPVCLASEKGSGEKPEARTSYRPYRGEKSSRSSQAESSFYASMSKTDRGRFAREKKLS